MTDTDLRGIFWNTLLRAIETEPREARTIQGESGFSHPVVALGVDEKTRRVVLISGEGDARTAALAHADIQAALPSAKLLMARPAPINLGQAARVLSELIGRVQIGPEEFAWMQRGDEATQNAMKEFVSNIPDEVRAFTFGPFAIATLNLVAAWKDVVQQLSLIEVEAAEVPTEGEKESEEGAKAPPIFDLRKLIAYDPVSVDRSLGVCSIPLYDFTPENVEVFHSGKDVDTARELLKQKDVFQYFFPAADQLALGFVDEEHLPVSEVVDRLNKTPEVGHPFGQLELVAAETKVRDIVDALQDRGLLVEGEMGVEITPDGTVLWRKPVPGPARAWRF